MLHLIHPAFVHFTVALIVLGGVCEAWGILVGHERVARFGGPLVVIGTLSLLPTMVSGYLAANSLDVSPEGLTVLDAHERNGLVVLGVLLVSQVWKAWFRGELPPVQRKLYALWILVAVALTGYSALLGGELVYGHGVGVLAP